MGTFQELITCQRDQQLRIGRVQAEFRCISPPWPSLPVIVPPALLSCRPGSKRVSLRMPRSCSLAHPCVAPAHPLSLLTHEESSFLPLSPCLGCSLCLELFPKSGSQSWLHIGTPREAFKKSDVRAEQLNQKLREWAQASVKLP